MSFSIKDRETKTEHCLDDLDDITLGSLAVFETRGFPFPSLNGLGFIGECK
jgi:hypothetical protein